MNILNLAIDQ